MKLNALTALAVFSLAAGLAAPAFADSVAKPGAEPASYAPLATFAPLAGKTYRAEWEGENGAKIVDIAKWEMILDGHALQSTHRLEGGTYGGRTIFFYDEGAKRYVYHYFTTAGFHTMGSADLTPNGFTAEETVEGHPDIASVRSVATIAPGTLEVDVVYIGKDGKESPGGHRVYREIAPAGPLFSDTP